MKLRHYAHVHVRYWWMRGMFRGWMLLLRYVFVYMMWYIIVSFWCIVGYVHLSRTFSHCKWICSTRIQQQGKIDGRSNGSSNLQTTVQEEDHIDAVEHTYLHYMNHQRVEEKGMTRGGPIDWFVHCREYIIPTTSHEHETISKIDIK